MHLPTYTQTLQSTGGRVNEFVNPKYVDESKTAFKSPTRLECMMQDFPLLLPKAAKVGFTTLPTY
jgi:UDP-sugar pyrophosphorylase